MRKGDDLITFIVPKLKKIRTLNLPEPLGLPRPVEGHHYLFLLDGDGWAPGSFLTGDSLCQLRHPGGGVFKYFLPEMQHFIKPLKCEKNSELKEKLK